MELALVQIIMLVGGLICVCMVCKMGLDRVGIPAILAYLAVGFALSYAHEAWGLPGEEGLRIFEFLAKMGIIALLFHVGLESNLGKLLDQLKLGGFIWAGNVVVAGAVGYLAAWLLGLGWAPALVIAVALTATSVGIPSGVWEEEDAIDTEDGQLFLDVAEMDDISGVVFMAVLFSLLPALRSGQGVSGWELGRMLGLFAVRLIGFGAFCLLFSRYAEERVTSFVKEREDPPDSMLMVAGIGILIAAGAGLMGFSVAIGAFFAGLVFSRDPDSVRIDASFNAVYELFAPFFFIGVGLQMSPRHLGAALVPALVLVLAAVLGKLVGTALLALLGRSWRSATVLGVSMMPRAEITLIIAGKALEDAQVIQEETYAALVMVSAVTCVAAPVVLRVLIRRWVKDGEEGQ